MQAYRKVGAAVACIALASAPAIPVSASPLSANRRFILTDASFPADKYILDQACIMVELYYRMDEEEVLVYDPEEPEVVFGKWSIRHLYQAQAEDSIVRIKRGIRRQVKALMDAPAAEWTPEQQKLRAHFPAAWSVAQAAASANRAVSKRGLRKAFRLSLERAYPYQALIDSAFRSQGVPTRLKHLAHIESWFNPEAVSKAGAAGIWQFLKSSGNPYMAINDRVDQRFDPYASTAAAARFLRRCHGQVNSWPLAIMSYNNGTGQILDAVKETGSRNASEIIQNYEAGGFGIISRNYYAMYLAASSLAERSEKLFPGLRKRPSQSFKIVKLEHEWTPQQLRILTGYSNAVIRRCNPALRPVVFERNLPVPEGFQLRLPAGLPTSQDLQFSDLRIGGGENGREGEQPTRSFMAGLPIPESLAASLHRIKAALFPERRRDDVPLMAYMHSQGLLDARRLALAKQDNILIEPHPALQAVIRSLGG